MPQTGVLDSVAFELDISNNSVDPPNGFLFLCPPRDFQSGTTSLKWPDCSAYWSLHPSGAERLSMEDAVNLGFPHVELNMTIMDREWHFSNCVYAGLRQFHEAKGFDPDTQDVARHLGQPLYRLLDEVHGTFSRCKSTRPNLALCFTHGFDKSRAWTLRRRILMRTRSTQKTNQSRNKPQLPKPIVSGTRVNHCHLKFVIDNL
jgi:hypothetical protein